MVKDTELKLLKIHNSFFLRLRKSLKFLVTEELERGGGGVGGVAKRKINQHT